MAILDRDGKRVAASEEWASLDGIAWAPGGREVWFTASLVGADNAVRALSLDGRVRTVLSGMGRLVLHDLAPDGRVLLERATLRSEMLFRRAGEPEDRDLSWLDFSAPEGIAPDGGTVLFYESGQGGGADYSTFLRKTDGSLPVRVGSGRALALSPDGRWVLSVSLRKPDSMDLTPTGPGENRKLRVPGLVAHEAAGFVGKDGRIFVTGRDAAGKRATWLTDIAGATPRRLPLPEGHILMQNTFSPDGEHFVTSCPEKGLSCLYDTDTGDSVPVRGAQKGWWPVGWDARGRLYFRDRTKLLPETLWRVDPATGRATSVAELAPRDRAGVARRHGRPRRRRRRGVDLQRDAPPLRAPRRHRREVALPPSSAPHRGPQSVTAARLPGSSRLRPHLRATHATERSPRTSTLARTEHTRAGGRPDGRPRGEGRDACRHVSRSPS